MNQATIRIPTPLRTFTKGADEIRVQGATVAEALANLGEQCPGILERVLDKDGKLRAFVNVYVGPSDVRSLQGLATKLESGSIVSIIPAVAGGIPAVAGGIPAVAGGIPAVAGGIPAVAGGAGERA